ncbi:DUF4142 domain-containing protein [Consotaella salsifontis]|uniref:Putative membrane protein n=1 Tax=Consotaella salsifontis TaxID=1365950 RepID=A0A1T4T4M1_9HYPH|nr:DUF4142 domain-containing protein [Consotaella salsifontis]SKA35386.1 putative membrane protein [Consotaella salsifontis]
MKRELAIATLALSLTSSMALAQTSSGTNAQTAPTTQTQMPSDTAKSAASGASTAAPMANPTTAATFVPMAAQSNMMEIEAAQLALKTTKSDDVRDFAQRMVDDHTTAGKNLKAAVKDAGSDISVPKELDSEHQQKLDMLKNASGDDFDKAYIQMNVQAHQQAVDLFQNYSQNGEQGPVRSFASKTLPTLQEHLQMVQKMDKSS